MKKKIYSENIVSDEEALFFGYKKDAKGYFYYEEECGGSESAGWCEYWSQFSQDEIDAISL